MEKTILTKTGRWMLAVSSGILLVFIIAIFLPEELFDMIPALLKMLLCMGALICLCLSFPAIYYHSAPAKRKKAIRVIAIISGSIFLIGWFFKFMHWPGASVCCIFSSFLFCFGALPLIIKSRYESRKILLTGKTLILSIADLLSILAITIGLLSRILHWPGGNYLIMGGVGVLVLTFILWNISFRKEVKLRFLAEEKLKESLKEIEEKHLIIEEKNKEITDSITYARRIQEAILPPLGFINEHVHESFVYYQPKDIVAGDFYWAEKTGNVFLIAAADCTGHGVPGALVSVVCSNALNRSVKEFKLSDPGKILDKTRELVLENFSKSKEAIKDGMDISLLSIEKTADGYTIKWAGANNPLWYISPFAGDDVLHELKADKQPIGFTDDARPFTTHRIEAQTGDTFYLFTDGYADQFGGPKGKKFKYKQFEELLLSLGQMPLKDQQEAIFQALKRWKGSLEQIDDVCIIGIRP